MTSDIGRRINVAARVSGSLDLTRAKSQTLVQTASATDRPTIPWAVVPTTTYPNSLREPSDLDYRSARMFSGENYKVPHASGSEQRKRAPSRPEDTRHTQTVLTSGWEP